MVDHFHKQLVDPVYYSSATALGNAIRRKEVSSEEITRAFLERIEEINPGINAVVAVDAEGALGAARLADRMLSGGEVLGPLHGIPFTLKDSIDTAGLVSTAGTMGRKNYIPKRDATVAIRLRNAGAILLGKTNTPELTLSNDTNNRVYGRTVNPYCHKVTVGGSSGGAAAAIACGASAFDIGSDTAGSIRFPAHCCGIAGIKPTSGRVPRTGHAIPFGGIFDSFTQLGPMARYVDDLTLLLPSIIGADWRDPTAVPMPLGNAQDVRLGGLRVSFHADNGIKKASKEIEATIRQAAIHLQDCCAIVEEARPACIDQTEKIWNGIYCADGGAHIRSLLELSGTNRPEEKWINYLKPTSMEKYAVLVNRWDDFRVNMASFLENYDVIISPVNASSASEPGHFSGSDPVYSYSRTYNLTGWPCTVVRAGTTENGVPIGIQIVSHPWREDIGLAVARYLEKAMVGFQPPPDREFNLDASGPIHTEGVISGTEAPAGQPARSWRRFLPYRKK